MGAVTGSFGGIIRDILGHVPSILLKHEIYVTASVLGACAYVALNAFEPARLPAMIAGFLVTFGVRGLAITFVVDREFTGKFSGHDVRVMTLKCGGAG